MEPAGEMLDLFRIGSLKAGELDTLISLLASPFLVIASLTTFVIGLGAFLAFYRWRKSPYLRERIDDAVAFGTARAFVISIPPAVFVVYSTIEAYA
jgi:hypothetical protein